MKFPLPKILTGKKLLCKQETLSWGGKAQFKKIHHRVNLNKWILHGSILPLKRGTGGPKGPPAARYGAKTWRWRDLLQHVLQEGTGDGGGI